jgi:hypothetical protein
LFAGRNLLSALSSSPIRKNKLPVSRQLWREIGSPQRQGRIFMKESIVLALLTAAMVFTGLPTEAAEGAKDKSTQTPKSEGKQRRMPFSGKVSAVDKTTKSVTLDGREKSRTFQITSATKITKNGKPAVMDDVIAGQTVGGLAKETAPGKWEVVTLNIGGKAGRAKDAR